MKAIEVYLDLAAKDAKVTKEANEAKKVVLVGTAYLARGKRQISTTFSYDATYLANGGVNIDPSLQLVAGAQHQRGLLRAFADTSPDRWGRNILDKAEQNRARTMNETPRSLDDSDYLLGVSDNTRQGALRFKLENTSTFLGSDSKVPKLISLPALMNASARIAAGDDAFGPAKQLLDTGTTGLGGARPKASVQLEGGGLGIAKFPHQGDQWDVMAWECTALDLLSQCAVRTPKHQLIKVGEKNVLLIERFDRRGGQRLGYLSAMSATQSEDGEHRDYADIALAVRELSGQVQIDLLELFRRVVFNVAFGNTDDHLRNHGFILDVNGWSLSPVFDVNPNPELGKARATSILGADIYSSEANALLAFADECDLSLGQGKEHIAGVISVVKRWPEMARRNGVCEREMKTVGEAVWARLEALQNLLANN